MCVDSWGSFGVSNEGSCETELDRRRPPGSATEVEGVDQSTRLKRASMRVRPVSSARLG